MSLHRLFPVALLYIALGLGANGLSAQGFDAVPRDGGMRALVPAPSLSMVSDLPFVDEDDREMRLSDYRGRYVLLNFWATWCAPCRHEMPSLNALQKEFGGEDFEVVTLATMRNSPQAIRRFFEEEGIDALPMFRDPDSDVARDMDIMALPITVLIDPEGREIARLRGDADWASPEAFALFGTLLGRAN